METATKLTEMEAEVLTALMPMFPHLGKDVVKGSILHPSNREEPLNNHNLLNRCIDDLLEMRTFSGMETLDLTEGMHQDVLRNSPQRFEEVEDHDNNLNLSPQEDPLDDFSLESRSTRADSISPSFGNDFRSSDRSVSTSSTPSPNLLRPIGVNNHQQQFCVSRENNISSPNRSDTLSTPSPNLLQQIDQQLGLSRENSTPSPSNERTLSTPNMLRQIDQQLGVSRENSTPSPSNERQLSTPSPVSMGRQYTLSPEFDFIPTDDKRPLINSPSLEDHAGQNNNTPPQTNSSTAIERDISTPSPSKSQSYHDQYSALSPDRPPQTPSPDMWKMFNSPSHSPRPDDAQELPTMTNQRQLVTPNPMSVDHRQLATPSPMSVSSEESSNSVLNPQTRVAKIPSNVISKPDRIFNGTKLGNDSGFGSAKVSPSIDLIRQQNRTISLSSSLGSATVSPSIDLYETSHNRTFSLHSSPESTVKESKSFKHTCNGKHVIDLTSPEKSPVRETFYFGGLTDEMAENMTASQIEAALSGDLSLPLVKDLHPSDPVSNLHSTYMKDIHVSEPVPSRLSDLPATSVKDLYLSDPPKDLYRPEPVLSSVSDFPSTSVKDLHRSEPVSSRVSNPPSTSVNDLHSSVPSSFIPMSTISRLKKLSSNSLSNGVILHSVESRSPLSSVKCSASSTSTCACGNCRMNNLSNSRHSKTGPAGLSVHGRRSTAPATISRPPLSPISRLPPSTISRPPSTISRLPPATISKPPPSPPGVSESGVSLKTHNATNMNGSPESSLANSTTNNAAQPTNAKPFKDTMLHTCKRYKGEYETFPGIENTLNKRTSVTTQVNESKTTSKDPDTIAQTDSIISNKVEVDRQDILYQVLSHQKKREIQAKEAKEQKQRISELVNFLREPPEQSQPFRHPVQREYGAENGTVPLLGANFNNFNVQGFQGNQHKPQDQQALTLQQQQDAITSQLAIRNQQRLTEAQTRAQQADDMIAGLRQQAAQNRQQQANHQQQQQAAQNHPQQQPANYQQHNAAPNRPQPLQQQANHQQQQPAAQNRPQQQAANHQQAANIQPPQQAINHQHQPAAHLQPPPAPHKQEQQPRPPSFAPPHIPIVQPPHVPAFAPPHIVGEGDFGEVPEEVIFDITSEVLNLFGDADPDWVRTKVENFLDHGDVVSAVCNDMLENGFPQLKDEAVAIEPKKTTDVKKVNYFTEYDKDSLYVSPQTERQGHRLLQNEFRRLSCNTIAAVMALFNNHYAPTKKCLEELINNNVDVNRAYNSSKYTRADERKVLANVTRKVSGKEVVRNLRVEVNKSMRAKFTVASKYEAELQDEIDFFSTQVKCDAEERDRQLALELNEHEYEAEGQLIECLCCYGDTTFDDMVQCSDGHLFCQTCLQKYIQEATYGEGKAQIVCMTDGCDSTFPRSQLQKALSTGDLAKYDDRVGEESLQLADMGENLVRCPFCHYAALMAAEDKVFMCQAAECKKETCRYCKEEWKDHFGIPCEEIEKKSDTKTRVSYEERMTMAKIRSCHRCKAGFTKSEGCNKMTCRCGGCMCYICRKPGIDYNHFCRHPRDPGHECKKCKACSLWSNPEEDDERAVNEIRKQMEDEKKAREKRAATTEQAGPEAKKQRIE